MEEDTKWQRLDTSLTDDTLPPLNLPQPGDEKKSKTWIGTKYFGPGNNVPGDVRDIPSYPPEIFAQRHDKNILKAAILPSGQAQIRAIADANITFYRQMESWWKKIKNPTKRDVAYYFAYKAARGTGAMDAYTRTFAQDFRKELTYKLRGLR